MSSSTVTYTSISSDYDEPSDADYVHGPREPEQASLSLDYVPEPEYLEYLVPSDAEAPMEDQPLPDDASPTTLLPDYDADSDPKEDSEEDAEEDPADYLADGGDNADDDDDDVDEEDEKEEEHLASADSFAVAIVDLIPSSPLPLPSPSTTRPTYAEAPLGYREFRIRLRATSPSTHHPSKIPSTPLLLPSTTQKDDLLEADMPLWKRARFTAPTSRFKVGDRLSAAAARQVGQALAHIVDYGFIDTVDASIRAAESRAMTAIKVVNNRVKNLAITQ
nr:hypothetical protein [Tanacetum cinerariifolium]